MTTSGAANADLTVNSGGTGNVDFNGVNLGDGTLTVTISLDTDFNDVNAIAQGGISVTAVGEILNTGGNTATLSIAVGGGATAGTITLSAGGNIGAGAAAAFNLDASGSDGAPPGNGGTVTLEADNDAVTVGNIDISGGNATAAGAGGDAGSLNVGQGGNVPTTFTSGTITSSGGDANTTGKGGDGGSLNITIVGPLAPGALDTTGGASAGVADGASGGSVTFISTGNTVTVGEVDTSGSDATGTGNVGGNAGFVTFSSNLDTAVGNITASGGNGNITAGNGGIVSVASTSGNITLGNIDTRSGTGPANGAGMGGNVTLTGATGIFLNSDINTSSFATTGQSGDVRFNSALTIADSPPTSTIVTTGCGSSDGDITFNGNVDGTTAGNADLSLNAGTGGTISTAAAADFGRATQLGTLTIVDSGNTTFNGEVDADRIAFTDISGNIIFNDVIEVASGLTVAAGTYAVEINNGGAIGNGAAGGDDEVRFNNTGGVTLNGGAGGLTFGATSDMGLISTASDTTVSGTIRTTNSQITLGNVTLTANANIDTQEAGNDQPINITSITGGGNQLELIAGNSDNVNAGPITVTGNVDNVSLLTITDSRGTTFQGDFGQGTAGAVTITDTRDAFAIAFQGNTHITTLITTLITTPNNYVVSFTGSNNQIDTNTTFLNTSQVTFGNGGDVILFLGSVDTTAATAIGTEVNGTVRTNGATLTFGNTDLSGNSVLDTTNTGNVTAGANVTVSGTLSGGLNTLNIDSGNAGTITVTGNVDDVSLLTITNSAGATFQSDFGQGTAGNVNITDTEDGQTVAFQGNTTINILTTTPQGYNVSFTGGSNDVDGAGNITSFLNTGNVTCGDSDTDSIDFTNGLDTTAANRTVAAGTITATANADIDIGEFTLTGNVSIDSGSGNINTGNVTGNDNDLTVDALEGLFAGDITIASINPVGVLTITDSGNTTITGSANIGTVNILDTSGNVSFQGNTDVTVAFNTANAPYAVSFTGSDNTIAGDTNFINTGNVTLGDDGDATDSIEFTGGLATAGNASNPNQTNTAATITTSNADIDLGTLSLTGNTTITSSGGNINITGDTNGAFTLTIDSRSGGPDGNVDIQNVGNTTRLTGLTVTADSGTVNIDGTTISTNLGDVIFTGSSDIEITTGGTLTIDTHTDAGAVVGGDVLFDPASNIDSAANGSLTIITASTFVGATAGNVIMGAVGQNDHLTNLGILTRTPVGSNALITLNGSIQTDGNIDFNIFPFGASPRIQLNTDITLDTNVDEMGASGFIDMAQQTDIFGAFDLILDTSAVGAAGFGGNINIGDVGEGGADPTLLVTRSNGNVGDGTTLYQASIEVAGNIDSSASSDIRVLSGLLILSATWNIDCWSANNNTLSSDFTDQLVTFNANGDVILDNVTLTAVNNGIAFGGNVDNVFLFGNIDTNLAINFSPVADGDTITLSADASLTSGLTITTTGENINGPFNLTLDSTGVTTLNGNIGNSTPIGTGVGAALIINSAGASTFGGTVATASGITGNNAAGLITFQENVNIASGDTDTIFNGNVTLDGLTFTSAGNVTFGDAPIDSLTASTAPVTITTAAANANVDVVAATTLNANVTISAGAGNITLTGTVDGNNDLTLNSSGTTTINGNIGTGTRIGALTTDAAGTTSIGAANIDAQGGTITFNDPLILTVDTTHTDSGGTGITYGNTVDGAFSLTAITTGGGNITFSGNVGGGPVLTALTASSNNILFLGADINVTGGGNVDFTGSSDVDLNSNVTIDTDAAGGDASAGDVLFAPAGTIDGGFALVVVSTESSGNTDGAVQLGNAGDNTPLTSANVDAGAAQVDLGNVTTTGLQTYTGINIDLNGSTYAVNNAGAGITFMGNVDLNLAGGTVSVTTNGNSVLDDILFTGGIASVANESLSLNSGANGDIDLPAAPNGTDLGTGSLTVVNAANVDLNAATHTADGGISITTDANGAIDSTGGVATLDSNGLAAGANAGNITLDAGSGGIGATFGIDLTASGAANAAGAGGNGGVITVNADAAAIVLGNIDISGGNAGMDGAGGNAGTLNIGQTPPVPTTLTTGNITASGGDAAATAPGGFVGGTGATIAITTSGTGNYGNIDTRGGTSAATGGGSSADGADGGSVSLTSTGNTLTSGSINTSGRAGLDLLPAGLSRGGNAGDVTLSGVGATVTGAITALGGNNPLGIAPPAIIPGTGGIVNVSGTTGNLSVQGIDSSGGDATIIGFSGNAGTITLTGDGGITLNGNITAATGTPAGGFPPGSGAAITINDNTTLATQDIDISTGNTTGNVTFANNSTVNGMFALTLTAGNGDVAIQGAVGGTTPLTLLDVVSANNVSLAAVTTQGILTPTTINIGSVSAIASVINLSGNLSTDGSGLAMPTGNIRLNGNVTLTADVTLNTNDRSFNSGAPTAATGNITLVTGTVQSNPADSFGLGIDAGDNNVDLTGVTLTGLDHLVVITTGNASLAAVSVDDGSGNPLGAGVGIEVNAGNADLNGNLDADGGNIDLSDTATVVLNTDVSINTTANGGDIDLGSTNNTTITDSGTRQLTLNAANADITLDNVDVYLITFTAGNSVTLFGDLTASNAGAGSLNFGNIDDGNTITLAGNVTLTARSIDTVGEIINGNFNLTIVGGAGGAEFQAGLGILAAIGTGMGPAITVNSTSSTTFFNIVNTASGISGNNAAGLITFQENVTTAAGDTDTAIDGNVTLDGLTFTSGGNVTFGNAPVDSITLSSAAVLIRAAVKNITLEGATTGAQNLTLNSTGITLINGNIGVPTPVLSLTTNAGGTTNIMAATINASGGTITFNNPVVLLADTTHTDTGTTGITYGNTVDGAFSLTANTSGGTGNINFNGNVGVAAELTQLTGTSNADINFGAATSSVNTNGGNITFTAAGSINTAAAISLDAGDAANMDGGAGGDVTLNAMAGSIA